MEPENKVPKRKPTRLQSFDYSSVGAYFVTICTKDRKRILSDIIQANATASSKATNPVVGEGLAPPEYGVKLKPCGEVAEEQLRLLETRFASVTIEDYIIMPDHIHAIIFLHEQAGGASPSPTLNSVLCAFKSLTSRICKHEFGVEKIFQRSYADHIIRGREDYETRRKYIYENPMRWYYKHLHVEE